MGWNTANASPSYAAGAITPSKALAPSGPVKATAFRRSSTPIRALSRSLDCAAGIRCSIGRAVGVWTTCSSNGVALKYAGLGFARRLRGGGTAQPKDEGRRASVVERPVRRY